MRHNNRNRKFGRETGIRQALLASLAESLLERGQIKTTEAKAKSLRPFIEHLITKTRTGTLASRRLAISRLGTAGRAKKLLTVAAKYQGKAGGYTRIIKVPPRKSDASPMALIQLI